MGRISRNTRQKGLIRGELSRTDSFFTAEEIHKKLKKKDSDIGIATVYRFLNEMKKKNELHSYVCQRKSLYSRNEKNHCHFICEKCGKAEHIDIDSVDFIRKKIKGNVCHFQVDVFGICTDCLKKE